MATSTPSQIVEETKATSTPVVSKSVSKPPVVIIDSEIQNKIISVFGSDSVMVRVAKCESGYRQFDSTGNVLRGKINPKDVGIFQLNEKYHLAASILLGYDIYTVDGNIGYAKYLYDHQGSTPWNWSKPCWG